MAKKTEEAVDAAVPGTRTRKQRAKGNFGIFRRVSSDDAGYDSHETLWKQVKIGLESAVACEKYVKEHSEEFQGAALMVAQIKKVGEIKVQTKVTVFF